jgi:hypothetical protein
MDPAASHKVMNFINAVPIPVTYDGISDAILTDISTLDLTEMVARAIVAG